MGKYGEWKLVAGGHVYGFGQASEAVCERHHLPPALAALAQADEDGALVGRGSGRAAAARAVRRFLAGARLIRSCAPVAWDAAVQIGERRPVFAPSPDPVTGDGVVPHVTPFQVVAVSKERPAGKRSWMWRLEAVRFEDERGRTRLDEPTLTVHVGSRRHKELSRFVTRDVAVVDEIVGDRLAVVWERLCFTPAIVETAAASAAFQRIAEALMAQCFPGLEVESEQHAA